MHEGFQLREQVRTTDDPRHRVNKSVKFVKELVGKNEIDSSKIPRYGRLYEFPQRALSQITEKRAFLRVRGGELGLEVSKPPHIIVDPARRFAVYSEDFIAVPPTLHWYCGQECRHSQDDVALSGVRLRSLPPVPEISTDGSI